MADAKLRLADGTGVWGETHQVYTYDPVSTRLHL